MTRAEGHRPAMTGARLESASSDVGGSYIPALGFSALTALYDPLLRSTLRETTFKTALVAQARVAAGMRVLDLGAGTGTLTAMLQHAAPEATVVGADGDGDILARARAKAVAARQGVAFQRALADALPYRDGAFDRVVSSLLFHHLSPADKRQALHEVWRVLTPGGELHVADWGRPQNALMRALFVGVQLLDGFATTAESVAGVFPDLLRDAGFVDVRETTAFATIFGTLALYRATRP